MTLEDVIRTACLLEVTARKPGNVHPLASFVDCDWHTFAASADAIAPVLAGAANRPLGESILLAVEETRNRIGRNTNLGMILLLAPLAAARAAPVTASVPLSPGRGVEVEGISDVSPQPSPRDRQEWQRRVAKILEATTLADAKLVYKAIRLAQPGGLGRADREDVASAPSIHLIEAMRLAAGRDSIAKQYANNFDDVFEISEQFTARELPALERQIIRTHVERIAEHSDTLIQRKCGPEVAREASRRARAALEQGLFDTDTGLAELAAFDAWLRADGNRRNPGTTADLIAAALFVAICNGQVRCFGPDEIGAYARAIGD